jgi:protein TonB
MNASTPSATVRGMSVVISCLFHGVLVGASLMLPLPSRPQSPPAVVLPVELVEPPADVTREVSPRVRRWRAALARPEAETTAARPQVPVRPAMPPAADTFTEPRNAQPTALAPSEELVREVRSDLVAVAAGEGLSSPSALTAEDVGTTVRSGDSTTHSSGIGEKPPASSAAAAPGPMAALRPQSAAAPRITQAVRPGGGYQVRPLYPPSARRAGAEGTTLLKVHVLTDGSIGEVQIQRSAGHAALDQAAADAVSKWHFEPARSGSETVAVWVVIPVEFRLRGGL